MDNFHQFDLPQKALQAIDAMGFSVPTPVQAQTIPVALEGQDILGTAQTGTGKTGAFAIPLAAKILEFPDESVLVMAPTRELATQVISVFHQLLMVDRSVKTALLIGGESIERQFKQLRARPRLIVGTPGRINDHLKRGTLRLQKTRSLVLDETDLMLDMGFDVQIATIIDKMPKDRQTLMFSATLPKNIEKMASKYLHNPVRVSVGQQSTAHKAIEQEVVQTSDHGKYTELLKQLEQREGSIIIFAKTKRGADKLSVRLNDEGHQSAAIHGDLKQSKRDRVLGAFRKQKHRILVATDVAARGIDVPHIRHVINYDLPQCPKDYIHRIGRTGRAGETGSALSFVTKQERGKWKAIERLLDPNAKQDERDEPRRKSSRPSFAKARLRKPENRKFQGKSFKNKRSDDSDRDSNRERRFSSDSSRDSNKERRFSSDSGRDSNKERRFSSDSSRDSNKERRFSSDSSRDSSKERRFSSDSSRDSGKERRFSSDSSRDSNKERRFSSDSGNDTNKKRRFSSDSGKDSNKERRFSSDSSKDSNKERRFSSDSRNDTNKKRRFSSDSGNDSNKERRFSAKSSPGSVPPKFNRKKKKLKLAA